VRTSQSRGQANKPRAYDDDVEIDFHGTVLTPREGFGYGAFWL
jgi:hypothetical protein